MIDSDTRHIDIETDAYCLEDVSAYCLIDHDWTSPEPYSWGGRSGPAFWDGSVRIQSIQLGDLELSRAQLVAWIGAASVTAIEAALTETEAERQMQEAA